MHYQKDVCVVGGGPGGYVAAIRAALRGKSVVICEEHKLGGVCLHYGCIPTKTLLESAHLYHAIQHADTLGISVSRPTFSMEKAFAHVRSVSEALYRGIQGLIKKHNILVVPSRASCTSPNTVKCDNGVDIVAKNIILATGSHPLVPPIPGIDLAQKNLLTSRTLLEKPPEAKGRFLIIGAGPIGVEFASLYQTLGAEVRVVEMMSHILPQEDPMVADELAKVLRRHGIDICTRTTVKSIKDANTAILEASDGSTSEYTFDHLMVSAGIRPNTAKMGLDELGIQRDQRGFIKVDETLETTCPGVYAIGDIVDGPALAHKASYEGIVCVDNIAGTYRARVDAHHIPRCVYTLPQVASVGITESMAKEQDIPLKVGVFPYAHNGRALSAGEVEGFVKMLYHAKTGEILGAHMLGDNASELIHTVGLGITAELTEQEFMNTVFPHPTLSEMVQEATLSAYGMGVHA